MHINDNIKRVTDVLLSVISYGPIMFILKIIGIIILSAIVVKVGSRVIKKIFEKQKTFKYKIDSKRLDTMSTLLVSIFRYTIYIMALVGILSTLTDALNLKSIMAAAGIGGIALGLGAQSLIRDILSGAFIILEDQYAVGDTITIDVMTGVVEHLELRVTKIRNPNGDLHIIPNGEIKKVTNHTRGNKAVIVDIPVSYSADLDKVTQLANEICDMVTAEFETIVEKPKVLGITELGKDNMNLRIIAKALPNEHWEVERRIRRLIQEVFTREGIEFPDRGIARRQ